MLEIQGAIASLILGAVFAVTIPGNHRRAWVAFLSQLIATVLILAVVIPVLLGGPELKADVLWSFPVDRIGLRIDAVGAFFLSFSLPLTLLGTLYAMGYLAPFFRKRSSTGLHFAILNFVSLSFIIIYTVENAMVFLLGWEITALAAWLGVIWDYRNQKVRFAGFNYLVSTHLSLLFLIAGVMLIHSVTHSFDFGNFSSFLSKEGFMRNIAFVLLMNAFWIKSAFFPFHAWAPRAEASAPAHISALMSGVIHKAGIYGILRFTLLIGRPEAWMGWYVLGISTLSAFMGALYAVSQRDLKRLLGYSSTENVGIAGIGIAIGYLGLCWNRPVLVALGFGGAILHVLNHALFKCLLFYGAGAIHRKTRTVDIERLGGVIKKMPQTAVLVLIGSLAIMAVPPFNGFVSEFLIYSGLFHHDLPELNVRWIFLGEAATLAFVGAISVLAITRAFGVSFLGSQRDQTVECHGEASWTMRAPMLVHALGICILGLMPSVGVMLISHPARLFFNLLTENSQFADTMKMAFHGIGSISEIGILIVGVCMGMIGLRWLLFLRLNYTQLIKHPKASVTWSCGYVATNPRMQFTGASFSGQFLSAFQTILKLYKREKLPSGYFPVNGYAYSHYVDAVERRMYLVLGEGEKMILCLNRRLKPKATFSFLMGLLFLLALLSLLVRRS